MIVGILLVFLYIIIGIFTHCISKRMQPVDKEFDTICGALWPLALVVITFIGIYYGIDYLVDKLFKDLEDDGV